MSGGSFNYACYKANDRAEILNGLDDYRDIEAWLRGQGRPEAADEVLKFVQMLENAQQLIELILQEPLAAGARIAPLLRAAEWTASCDSSIESVDEAMGKLVNP